MTAGQRILGVDDVITFLDLRSPYAVDWKDIGAITLLIPCLSSLPAWSTIQHWSRPYLPSRWELEQMRSLRHLNIELNDKDCHDDEYEWISPDYIQPLEYQFDLHVLPRLETLRIPVRLLAHTSSGGMRSPVTALPSQLHALVLFVDLRLNTFGPSYDQEFEWSHDYGGLLANDTWHPRTCVQLTRLTLEFLESLVNCGREKFPRLHRVTLEYEVDDEIGGRGWQLRNARMAKFREDIRNLEGSFQGQEIHFRITQV